MRPSFLTDTSGYIPGRRGSFRPRRLSIRLTAVVAAWVFLHLSSALGQHAKPTEYEVKATYLYNFSKFVQWPGQASPAESDAFAICVIGEDPFGRALHATVENETVGGKRVVVKQIPASEDAVNCRILFISSSEEQRVQQVLTSLGGASVLTVSDLPKFAQRGGMVQFVLEGNRVRFEVNSAAAERAGLRLSSELLKVAVNVRRSIQVGD
jgi:YfiR/HmsC-like